MPNEDLHTVDDTIRIQEAGLKNLQDMKDAFPDAYLSQVEGVGRVWTSEGAAKAINGFSVWGAPSGIAWVIPYSMAGNIPVYIPPVYGYSRSTVEAIRERHPDLHGKILEFLQSRVP
jgi:hypothetical protein